MPCVACVGKCGRRDQHLTAELAETRKEVVQEAKLRRQSRVEEDPAGGEEWGVLGFLSGEAPELGWRAVSLRAVEKSLS